jgi:NADH-quinone oxidoreductase subunit M
MASLNLISLTGAVFFLFADAMAMGLLFALAGHLYYQTHTLDIPSLGGLSKKMPFVATLFVIGSAASFGLPGGMNFIGEMMVFLGSFNRYPVQTLLAAMAITITWAYYFRMIRAIFFGDSVSPVDECSDAKGFAGRFPLVLLAAMTLFFGIFPSHFIRVIQSGVAPIVEKITATKVPDINSDIAQQAP